MVCFGACTEDRALAGSYQNGRFESDDGQRASRREDGPWK